MFEWRDQLSMKRKGNCKSWSAYLWRKIHMLYIQWKTNLSKRGDGSQGQITSYNITSTGEKMNIKFVMHRVKIYLNGSSLFSFYQGMLRTMKISFNKRKIYWDLCHFAYSRKLQVPYWKLCGLLTLTSI